MRALRTVAAVLALCMAGVASAGSYTVRPGDTLERIARRHGVGVVALASANGIGNPNHIVTGTRLTIPGGGAVASGPSPAPAATYTVRPGDTLTHVARRHGVALSALASANGITDLNLIVVGARLTIPGSGGGAPAAASSPSGAPAPAATYTVQAGDTLEGIGRRFGVSVRALAAANDITNLDLIRVGTTLVVPGAVGSPPPAPSSPGGTDRLPSRLRNSPERLALLPVFDHWAATYGVPADLLKAMTWMESGWQNHVVSHVGAMGIGQLMPDTVDFVCALLGERLDPAVPEQNIRMSARFMRFLLDQTGGRVDEALAGYYQGLASVRARGMLMQTVAYVESVQSLRPRFA